LYETGEVDLDGEPVIFAAVEQPDDAVGEVLRERTLEPDEARSMTSGVASGLAFLHEHNLCHGEVTAANVLICGEDIKLSVDTLGPCDSEARASDVMQFGLLLVRAITGGADREGLKRMPAPFAAIAKGCLSSPDREWTARRILDELEGRRPVVVMKPQAPRLSRLKLAVLGLGALAALSIGLVLWNASDSDSTAARSKPPEAAKVNPPEPEPKIVDARPSPFEPKARAQVKAAEGDWAVVAATYSSYSAAEHRAQSLVKQSPRLHAQVYPKGGDGNRFYVLLGSGMTRDEAERVRDSARHSGAPGDTYVTKLRLE